MHKTIALQSKCTKEVRFIFDIKVFPFCHIYALKLKFQITSHTLQLHTFFSAVHKVFVRIRVEQDFSSIYSETQ